jgi:hypothetical protein
MDIVPQFTPIPSTTLQNVIAIIKIILNAITVLVIEISEHLKSMCKSCINPSIYLYHLVSMCIYTSLYM